ncbi:MAG: hypothetical protein AB3N33_03565, partial [Puniceicoccaceae bacterium]
MKRFLQLSRIPLVAASTAACLVAPALEGQETSGVSGAEPSIMERSPFIPPDFTPPGNSRAAAAKAAASSYEFKGFYRIGDKYRFLVSEPRSNDGDWVELGESSDSYEVRRFDPESETLTLFFNNSEKQLQLTELAANPTPMPVSGQIKTPSQPSQQGAPAPVRRTIRPTTRQGASATPGTSNSPPPPAWLEKLREEAAARRAQAIQGRSGVSGGVNASGSPDYSTPPAPRA